MWRILWVFDYFFFLPPSFLCPVLVVFCLRMSNIVCCESCDCSTSEIFLGHSVCASCRENDPSWVLVTKGRARRWYLLQSPDFEPFECKILPNPYNKHYAPMKQFCMRDISIAVFRRWGTKEKLEEAKLRVKVAHDRVEWERKQAWFRAIDDIFRPMGPFMKSLPLPRLPVVSPFFASSNAKVSFEDAVILEPTVDIWTQNLDLILHCTNCVHQFDGYFARELQSRAPACVEENGKTVWRDRRKIGHFCAALTEDNSSCVVLLYTHFENRKAGSDLVVFQRDAFDLALRRVFKVLQSQLPKGLTIGKLRIGGRLDGLGARSRVGANEEVIEETLRSVCSDVGCRFHLYATSSNTSASRNFSGFPAIAPALPPLPPATLESISVERQHTGDDSVHEGFAEVDDACSDEESMRHDESSSSEPDVNSFAGQSSKTQDVESAACSSCSVSNAITGASEVHSEKITYSEPSVPPFQSPDLPSQKELARNRILADNGLTSDEKDSLIGLLYIPGSQFEIGVLAVGSLRNLVTVHQQHGLPTNDSEVSGQSRSHNVADNDSHNNPPKPPSKRRRSS
eukprot:Rmarinus@m.15128